jgi:hypothetical protein
LASNFLGPHAAPAVLLQLLEVFPKKEYVTPNYEEMFHLRRIKIASRQTSEYSIRAATNRVCGALYPEFRQAACESFPAVSMQALAESQPTSLPL